MKGPSSDPPEHELRLKVGEEHRIKLEGLGSAGYDWDLTLVGPEDLIRWSLEPVASESLDQVASRGSLPPDNVSLDKMLIINALQPGHIKLILRQRRPWERDRPPLKEIILDLQITG